MIVGSLLNSPNLPMDKKFRIEPFLPETYPFSHITLLVEYKNGSSTVHGKSQIMMTMGYPYF
jgi:hypothetical protein